jgi:hypothetical protein
LSNHRTTVKPEQESRNRSLRDKTSSLSGTMLLSKLNGEVRKYQSKPQTKLSKINLLIIKMSFKL